MSQSKKPSLLRASLVSALGTALSRVLGAVRDIALANVFGAGRVSDAFWMAWTVPSVFRRFVADEGLTGALIPAVAQSEQTEGKQAARRLANTALTALLLASLAICLGGILGAEWLVDIFAHGFRRDPEKFALTVLLTRWLFPFVALVSLVSFCEGLLNHRGHFFIPKLAPGLVAGTIAGSAILLAHRFQEPVFALVVGVLAGGLAHVLVCLPVLVRRWGMVRPGFDFSHPRFRVFYREMGKVVAIGLLAQINLVILKLLASLLEDGAVTHYWYANRVVDLAQGAIAVGVGSALLPVIARNVAAGDWQSFRANFREAVLLAATFLLPAAVLLALLAQPVVSVLFRHGAFNQQAMMVTSDTLLMLIPFMLALAGINIVKKVFFALDARTAIMLVGVFGIVVTAGAGYGLSTALGVKGLGLGLSVSAMAQLSAYFVLLHRKPGVIMGLAGLIWPLTKLALCAVPAGLASWRICRLGNWAEGPSLFNLMLLAIAGLAAAGLYLGLGYSLKIEPIRPLLRRILHVKRKAGS